MNSTFTGLSIATSGLNTASANLLVTSTNISNVDTEGYSQKVASQKAVGPAAVYNGSYVGSGSEVTSISRVRSFRLDQKYWQENSNLGELQTKSDMLTEVQDVIGTTDATTQFSTDLTAFSTALDSLESDVSDSSYRTELLTAGETFCDDLNNLSAQLTDLQEEINTDVSTTVEQINSYSSQIATLNKQIRTAAGNSADTSDLEDQRTLLIDKLSSLTDVTVTQTVVGTLSDGSEDTVLSVSSNGTALVSNGIATELACKENTEGMYEIYVAGTDNAFEPAGGDLKAYLDLRDGDGTDPDYQGIPYYLNQLNEFASTFASAFNTVHDAGYDADGSAGVDFFAASDGSTTITAANISVSITDPDKIAASSSSDTTSTSNSENLSDLIDLCEGDDMFGDSSAADAWTVIIATLGTEGEHAETMADKASSFVDSIDSRRSSVSGVSTNQETANLTKYQEAYNASAQVVSMWNEIYSTTINMVSSD